MNFTGLQESSLQNCKNTYFYLGRGIQHLFTLSFFLKLRFSKCVGHKKFRRPGIMTFTLFYHDPIRQGKRILWPNHYLCSNLLMGFCVLRGRWGSSRELGDVGEWSWFCCIWRKRGIPLL